MWIRAGGVLIWEWTVFRSVQRGRRSFQSSFVRKREAASEKWPIGLDASGAFQKAEPKEVGLSETRSSQAFSLLETIPVGRLGSVLCPWCRIKRGWFSPVFRRPVIASSFLGWLLLGTAPGHDPQTWNATALVVWMLPFGAEAAVRTVAREALISASAPEAREKEGRLAFLGESGKEGTRQH